MRTGDIVLIPFPFSDLTDSKARPALVITETKDQYTDLVLAYNTSNVPAVINRTEILLIPDSNNGLRTHGLLK